MDLDINSVSVTKEYPNGDVYEGILIKDLKEVKGTLTRNKNSSFSRELKAAQEKRKIIFYCADKEAAKKKFPDEKLNEWQRFYIKKFNSYKDGYGYNISYETSKENLIKIKYMEKEL